MEKYLQVFALLFIIVDNAPFIHSNFIEIMFWKKYLKQNVSESDRSQPNEQN